MNTRRLTLVVALLIGTVSGRSELLLRGITVQGGEAQFSLYSVEDRTSKWVSLGQSFSGYKISDYDAQTEVLTITKDALRQDLRMQKSTVKDSSSADSRTRLGSLQGLELAYELLRHTEQLAGQNRDLQLLFQGLGEKLKAYQGISARLQEVGAVAGPQTQQVNSAITFLGRQAAQLREQVEIAAALIARRFNSMGAAP